MRGNENALAPTLSAGLVPGPRSSATRPAGRDRPVTRDITWTPRPTLRRRDTRRPRAQIHRPHRALAVVRAGVEWANAHNLTRPTRQPLITVAGLQMLAEEHAKRPLTFTRSNLKVSKLLLPTTLLAGGPT